jgi:hypothetical protein
MLAIATGGPTAALRYAAVEGRPLVFTLSTAAIQPFLAEFHDRQVLSFPIEKVKRLTLRWPNRTLRFARHPRASGGAADWKAEPGSDASGFDVSRLNALAVSLARLTTSRFAQYAGILPARAGLDRPRLVIEVELADSAETPALRVGQSDTEGRPYATTTRGDSGAVFVLDGAGWADLLRPASPAVPPPELPADVFAPPSPRSP